MFLITHNGEVVACVNSMTQAKDLQKDLRHKPGSTSIIHADNQIIGEFLDQEAMLAAERDWSDEQYLQPHHD